MSGEGPAGQVRERLACGHTLVIAPGVRLYSHYCCGFGVVRRVGDDGWHDLVGEGAEYWPEGRRQLLNAERVTCVPCGEREEARRGSLS